jgi:hypothetical protein
MASTANININLDSKDAEKSLKSLNAEGKKTKTTFAAVDKTFDEVYGGIKPLTNRLGEAEDRLYELSLAGKRGSEEFKALLNEAARLRTQMIQTDMVVDAMASTLTTKLLAGAGGVTASFGLAQGALVAFGSESEALNAALTRLAGIMTVLQSLNELRQSLPVLQGLMSGFGAQFNGIGKAAVTSSSDVAEYASALTDTASAIADVSTAAKTSKLSESLSGIGKVPLSLNEELEKLSEDLGKVFDTAYDKSTETVSKVKDAQFAIHQANFDLMVETNPEEIDKLINKIDGAQEVLDDVGVFSLTGPDFEESSDNLLASFEETQTAIEGLSNSEEALEASRNSAIKTTKLLEGSQQAYFEIQESKYALDQANVILTEEMIALDELMIKLDEERMNQALGLNTLSQEELILLEEDIALSVEKIALIKAEAVAHEQNIIAQQSYAQNLQELSKVELTRMKYTSGLITDTEKLSDATLNKTKVDKAAAAVTKFFTETTLGLTTAIGLGVIALGAAAYALYQYYEETSKAAEEAAKLKKEQEQLKKAAKAAGESIASETSEFLSLILALKATNSQSKERKTLIKEINDTYGTTLKNLQDEFKFQEQVNGVLNDYIEFQRVKYRLQANDARTQKLYAEEETLTWKIALEGQKQLREFKKQEFRATKEQIKETEKSLKLENLIANYKMGTLSSADAQYAQVKRIVEIQGQLESLGVTELALKKKLGTYSYKDKDDKNKLNNQKGITIAYEESLKAWEAYQEALSKDRERPVELTNYEKEVQALENGQKALESKRVAAYEEEKKNAEGLYKDKQLTSDQYDARLIEAATKFEKEKLEVNKVWADRRAEFDKNWNEEQRQISKIANAEAVKSTTQSKLDELSAQKALDLQAINDSKATQIAKDKAIMNTHLQYLDETNKLVKERRDADLVLLDATYEQQMDNINLNEAQKLQITAKYEADKVKLNLDANNQISQNESDLTNSIREEFEVRQAAVQQFGDIYNESLSSLGTTLTDAINGDFANISDNFKALSAALVTEFTAFDEIAAKWDDLDFKGKVAAIGEAVTAAAEMATQAISAIFEKQNAEEQARLEEKYANEDRALTESLEAKLVSQEEYESIVKTNEAIRKTEETQLRREAFESGKKVSRANAVISGANAVLQALATIPPPFGYIAAGVSAVAAGVQLGAIDRQQFTAARGGVVPGNGDPNRDSVDALLAPGEMVINSRSSGLFPELLSAINQMGGGISLAPSTPAAPLSRNTVFGNGGQMRAYVVESDISDSQRRVQRYTRNGSY